MRRRIVHLPSQDPEHAVTHGQRDASTALLNQLEHVPAITLPNLYAGTTKSILPGDRHNVNDLTVTRSRTGSLVITSTPVTVHGENYSVMVHITRVYTHRRTSASRVCQQKKKTNNATWPML